MQITIHIDGGARGNPGPAATGVVIQSVEPAFTLHEGGYFLGKATNNVAEYQGLIRGLELAVDLGATDARIFSDSELMVRQIRGEYKVKSPDLKPLYEHAQRLLLQIDLWQIQHVYRTENKRADELVNMAIDAKRDVVVVSASDFLSADRNPHLVIRRPLSTTSQQVVPKASITRPSSDVPGVLRWTATLASDDRDGCPAPNCLAGKPYSFTATTPQGLCVHAAKAALDNGPLVKADDHETTSETKCSRCGVIVKLEKL